MVNQPATQVCPKVRKSMKIWMMILGAILMPPVDLKKVEEQVTGDWPPQMNAHQLESPEERP